MSGAGIYSPVVVKETLDHALAGIVAGLDRKHYPTSLLELLERVLLPGKSLRGLPLLTCIIGESGIPDNVLMAQEMLLRGWFLQAELSDPYEGKFESGLAASIRKDFTPAQVLLAADTLFTLPFELLAASSEKYPEVVGRFSALFGPEGALGELDRAEGGDFKAFIGTNPVHWLIAAALGEKLLRDVNVSALSRFVWLREAKLWFGGSAEINSELESLSARLKGKTAESSAAPPGTRWRDLYVYLGIC